MLKDYGYINSENKTLGFIEGNAKHQLGHH